MSIRYSHHTWVGKHKNGAEENLVESVVSPGVSYESEQDRSDMQIDPPSDAGDEHEIYPETVGESQFFNNLALFYFKLQAKCLLTYRCLPLQLTLRQHSVFLQVLTWYLMVYVSFRFIEFILSLQMFTQGEMHSHVAMTWRKVIYSVVMSPIWMKTC